MNEPHIVIDREIFNEKFVSEFSLKIIPLWGTAYYPAINLIGWYLKHTLPMRIQWTPKLINTSPDWVILETYSPNEDTPQVDNTILIGWYLKHTLPMRIQWTQTNLYPIRKYPSHLTDIMFGYSSGISIQSLARSTFLVVFVSSCLLR